MTRRYFLIVVAVSGLLAGAGALLWPSQNTQVASPETVLIAAGPQDYRPAGEFRQGTRVVDAPIQHHDAAALKNMKYHVSQPDYALCMADDACPPAPTTNPTPGQADSHQTNINHADAIAYAVW